MIEKRHSYPRSHRLNESRRQVLAEEVERLRDPRIGFVTITGVEVTTDLHHARVWYSVLGEEEARTESRRGLRAAAPHLRRTIGRQVRMKRIPELHFEEDPAIETGRRVEKILRELGKESS